MKYVFALVLLAGSFANATPQDYYVEPMICEGQWNKQPPQYDPSYKKGAIRVFSFWSTRRDCSLAPSSATEPEFAAKGENIKFMEPADLGSWIAEPLKIDGNVVSIPNGVWANRVELTITGTSTVDGKQVDTLEGRETLFDDYYYDLKCTAVVVKNPTRIVNNTTTCP